jgi:hypothetical protein
LLRSQFRDIDTYQLPTALAKAATDHDGIDIGAANRLDNGANGVGHREHGDCIGAQHDDVGLLAWRERTNGCLEARGAGTVDGGSAQYVSDRDRGGRIGFATEAAIAHRRTLLVEQRVHLAKQVAAECSVQVDTERGRQSMVDRLLISKAIVIESEQRVRARIDSDIHASIRE